MEGHMKKWKVGFVGLMLGLMLGFRVNGSPQVPCYFIFGDSLVDSGNNNRLLSLARADYLPYGIDFPRGPTGRFSNGKNSIDVMAELLGFDHFIPPYSEAIGEEILSGVNYASAAAGIREETGRHLGGRISFRKQVHNHKKVVSRVVILLGDAYTATKHLNKCIYSIGLGSNDYLNNYFMPASYSSSRRYTPEQYADDLIQLYSQQLIVLYNYGARKFTLNGLGAVGCTPGELAVGSPDGRTCSERINSANRMFNDKLISLVDRLNNDLPDAKFIYTNNYGVLQELLDNPFTYGFRVTNAGCCGVGKNRGLITCVPGVSPCLNRNEYVFWDAFHPTEAANAIITERFYRRRLPSDAYPIDISTLAQL